MPETDRLDTIGLDILKVGYNPRKKFTGIDDLAASMRESGLTARIIVRPAGSGFEIVDGERRFRAARQLKWNAIDAIVRDLDDDAALTQKAIANDQREDVHPLEQAECYARLLKTITGSAPIGALAARVGRSATFVAQRLRLNDLDPFIRKLYADDEISLVAAIECARLPTEQQKELAAELKRDTWLRSDDAIADKIRRTFILRLKDAPFQTGDAQLVKDAGACGPCPKRGANALTLFPDIGKEDVCTDAGCYQRKVDAHWLAVKREASVAGKVIADEKKSEAWFDRWSPGNLAHSAPVVKLDAKHPADPKGRTWRKLLKAADDASVATIVARDPSGGAHELVDRKLAEKAIKAGGESFAKPASRTEDASQKAAKKLRDAAANRKQQTRDLMSAIVFQVERKALDSPTWLVSVLGDLLLDNLITRGDADAVQQVCMRRDIPHKDASADRKALKKHADELTSSKQAALAIELALAQGAYWSWAAGAGVPAHMVEAAKAAGLDPKKIKTEAAEARKIAAKAQALHAAQSTVDAEVDKIKKTAKKGARR